MEKNGVSIPTCRTPMADGDRCRNCGWLLSDHLPDPKAAETDDHVQELTERIIVLEAAREKQR